MSNPAPQQDREIDFSKYKFDKTSEVDNPTVNSEAYFEKATPTKYVTKKIIIFTLIIIVLASIQGVILYYLNLDHKPNLEGKQVLKLPLNQPVKLKK